MKRSRVFLAGTVSASSFIVFGAEPGERELAGDPNVCRAVCRAGLGNKYTRDLVAWCYIT